MECLICREPIHEHDQMVVQNPRQKGLETIIKISEKRQDGFSKLILLEKDHILSGKIKVKYHKACRQSYTSVQNVRTQNIEEQDEHFKLSSRSSQEGFNIRIMCLICNRTGKKGKQRLTSVQTGTGKSTFNKVMEAAKKRDDIDMISKLSCYEDLFAYDAKYHNCEYIASRSIKATQNKNIKNPVSLKNTSVLNEEVGSSSSSDSFDLFTIPTERIKIVDDRKQNYIHASIDNFDLNEDTIDGKNTTHCMAMVAFQNHDTDQSFVYENIPREGAYSLGMEELQTFTQSILKYRKPMQRPEPAPLKKIILDMKTDNISKKINTTWRLLRNFEEDAKFPNWSEYNNIISENKIPVSDIFYLPFINNPPTEFDTIYTSMVRLVELANAIKQNHIIITADLAIYSKAQEILWNNPEPQDKVTLMLGGMHLNMAFIASIGYIFSDGGLCAILTETDTYAENTCKMMLEGKQYSRAIRGLTLVGDALSRLFFQSVLNWCESQENLTFLTPELKANLQSSISNSYKTAVKEERALLAKNEQDVLKIIRCIETDWCNPFNLKSVPSELINICTGKILDGGTEKNLVNFLKSSQESFKFVK
ncbi:unnamed protein product [Ceutorhynchus assimilis]|uniref:Uncharacterized protein n=1 Tax=Ceutorhynchus assimilis TaxID=467358 RepID=A0A9N9MCJ3_9CUCU|nr:unnamed protein product [Ceutorhynchus assimilis]